MLELVRDDVSQSSTRLQTGRQKDAGPNGGMRHHLQVVGFRGFNTHVYDEDHVQFPGNLADCTACHGDSGYQLPLASSVLGSTIDTGSTSIRRPSTSSTCA